MNARVFKAKAALVEVVVHIIKDETAIWVLAGARHLGNAMPQEWPLYLLSPRLFCMEHHPSS